jgi:hypothetical protein
VDLVEVDPVGLQALEALLNLLDDPAPGVAATVAALAHLEVDLGGEHDVVTSPPQCLSHDFF